MRKSLRAIRVTFLVFLFFVLTIYHNSFAYQITYNVNDFSDTALTYTFDSDDEGYSSLLETEDFDVISGEANKNFDVTNYVWNPHNYGTNGYYLENKYGYPNKLIFSFHSLIREFGFIMGAVNSPYNFYIYKDNVLLDTISDLTPQSTCGYFVGILYDEPFDKFIVENKYRDWVLYDNITYTKEPIAPVPEPAPFLLITLGLFFLYISKVVSKTNSLLYGVKK